MKKTKLNYLVDFLMGLSFLGVAFSGLVLFLTPGGIRRGGYQDFLEVIRQDWIKLHNLSGIIMTLLVLLHLVLHWGWIINATKKLFEKSSE